MLGSGFGLRRSRTILFLNKMFSCKSLIFFSLSACYSKVYTWLFYNSWSFSPFLNLYCFQWPQRPQQPESQNDRNAEMTIKQERPERWNDQKKRNDGSDTCVIICTGAKKHTAWIGKADRPQFRFRVLFFVRFSYCSLLMKFDAPKYWRSYKWDELVCCALPINKVIA
jgi:hypothetical protein